MAASNTCLMTRRGCCLLTHQSISPHTLEHEHFAYHNIRRKFVSARDVRCEDPDEINSFQLTTAGPMKKMLRFIETNSFN